MSDPKPQAQEAQKIPTSTNNEKKNKPQKNLNKLHYHIQTAENQKPGTNLARSQIKKLHLPCRATKVRITVDFLSGKQAGRDGVTV